MNKINIIFHVNSFLESIVINKEFDFKSNLSNFFSDFPNWKCHWTSSLLQYFLKNELGLIFDLVDVSSSLWDHTFLENKEYIIDITAYQFRV